MGQLQVKQVGQFALKRLGHYLLKQVGQLTVKWVGQYGLIYSDQAVDSVNYVENNPENGSLISISNNNKLVMPVKMEIVQANGRSEIVELPVQVWLRGNEWTMKYNSTSKIEKVIIDPNKEFPDVKPGNNIRQTETATSEKQSTGKGMKR